MAPRSRSLAFFLTLAFACMAPACGSSGPALSEPGLRLRVVEEIGGLHGRDLDYCDPDIWPVGDDRSELEHARERFNEIKSDGPMYRAILGVEEFPTAGTLSDRQTLVVYQDWKEANEVVLAPTGEPREFSFALNEVSITGTVTGHGDVDLDREPVEPNEQNCPVCLARDTGIAVPGGFVRVQDLRVGMAVWSTDATGRHVRSVVLRVGRTPVSPTHEVVRLVLADGRTVLVSPGHPTPDAGAVGELRAGRSFEGSTVVSARRIAYSGGFTFDLLPSGPTGTYFANGVLLGSTLDRGSGLGPQVSTG